MGPTLTFVGQWLRSPIQTAAVLPSSRRLAAAMAQRVPSGTAPVIELGAGTGAMTRALLRRGVDCGSLLVVEKNPSLCRILSARFPGVRVIEGDACALGGLVRDAGGPMATPARAVVSGLGLRAMNVAMQARICEEVLGVLDPHGAFVQFTYGARPPFDERVQARFDLAVERTDFILFNLPPASIYVYRRRQRDGADSANARCRAHPIREARGAAISGAGRRS